MKDLIKLIATILLCVGTANPAEISHHESDDIQFSIPEIVANVAVYDSNGDERYRFKQGEQIRIVISVQNLTDKPKDIWMGGSGSEVLVTLENVERVIWSSTWGLAFPASASKRVLAPLETWEFAAEWDQGMIGTSFEKTSKRVPAGTYQVIGKLSGYRELSADCTEVYAAARSIEISE
jgi:hypothetical protein